MDSRSNAFHNPLPQYVSVDLERLQKRELRIVFPGLLRKEALDASNLSTLKERREHLEDKLFRGAVEKEGYKLHKL